MCAPLGAESEGISLFKKKETSTEKLNIFDPYPAPSFGERKSVSSWPHTFIHELPYPSPKEIFYACYQSS